jgi:hypothetical protein
VKCEEVPCWCTTNPECRLDPSPCNTSDYCVPNKECN